MSNRIVAVYADGGVIRANPSPIGGTWAWCHVDQAGAVVCRDSGLLLDPLPVTNNQTEFAALVLALEALPKHWCGTVYSDSKVTLRRLFKGGRLANLTSEWVERGAAVLQRLGDVVPVHLSGHPTAEELAIGYRWNGSAVSEHQVWCDRECARLSWAYRVRQAEGVA